MNRLRYGDGDAKMNSSDGVGWSVSILLVVLVLCSGCSKSSNDQSQTSALQTANIAAKRASAHLPQGTSEKKNARETVPSAIGPSFDCAKAHSIPEKLICGDAELAADDARLASIYFRAKAAASDKNAFKEQTRRAWAWREANCKDKACMVTWYADHEKELTGRLSTIADATSCLRYEPSKAVLTGKLVSITFAGPPEYESVAKGDEAETGFYLQLSSPVCVQGDENDPMTYSQKDVKLVQLVLTGDRDYSAFRPYLGTTVTLAGTMFAAHTGHHHAPLLLQHVAKQ